MRAASSLVDPTGCGLRGVVGAEFRGRVHEGSFRVLGPEFKRGLLRTGPENLAVEIRFLCRTRPKG